MKSFFLLFSLIFSLSCFAKNPAVVVETTLGSFDLELYEEKAPITVKNFLSYVDDKFYDGTIFHRVLNGFMIQGGGMTEKIKDKPGKAPIKNEASNGLKNLTGTIAMARTGEPNSATSQFFINVNNNSNLDYPSPDGHGYAVFGKVTSGMEVVDKIKAVRTGRMKRISNIPYETVVIKSIRRK